MIVRLDACRLTYIYRKGCTCGRIGKIYLKVGIVVLQFKRDWFSWFDGESSSRILAFMTCRGEHRRSKINDNSGLVFVTNLVRGGTRPVDTRWKNLLTRALEKCRCPHLAGTAITISGTLFQSRLQVRHVAVLTRNTRTLRQYGQKLFREIRPGRCWCGDL